MNIFILDKCIDQQGIFRTVRQNPEFDLGIIRGHHDPALLRDKGAADLSAFFGANGDVLKIRVRAAESAGGGNGLVIRSMNSARFRVDQIQKRVGIGGFQLGEGAMP